MIADKQLIVKHCMDKGVLPGADILSMDNLTLPDAFPHDIMVVTLDALSLIDEEHVDWLQLDRLRSYHEHGRSGYQEYIHLFSRKKAIPPAVHVQDDSPTALTVPSLYDKAGALYTVGDFVQHFKHRYTALERMLRIRPELQHSISVSRALRKQSREPVSIIGMVLDKSETKNGNLIITVEDPTGSIRVLLNKNHPDLFKSAKDLVLDEVIGISGVCGTKIIFANNLFLPDLPYTQELKKSSHDIYALFLSDVHVGSEYFLEKEFRRFLRWINGNTGTGEQKEIAKKVRYVFIAGDIVDGVGVYPRQEEELLIKDIYQQYKEFAALIAQIPPHIKVIICPGNHDALRLGEPQPILDREFAAPIYELNNVTIVSNPSLVNIHAQKDFSGFNILLYHGYSFDYLVANVDSIRGGGGYRRADLIMKFLLKRRHLAPAQGSTLRIPDPDTDPLVIDPVPDFFVTGHIHYSMVANYRNVTMISGSCWQRTTSFQEKLGHQPEPARVPVVNLKTRDVKILKFM